MVLKPCTLSVAESTIPIAQHISIPNGAMFGIDTIQDRPKSVGDTFHGLWYSLGESKIDKLRHKGGTHVLIRVYRIMPITRRTWMNDIEYEYKTFDSNTCHFIGRWEPVCYSRTARRIDEYCNTHAHMRRWLSINGKPAYNPWAYENFEPDNGMRMTQPYTPYH